MRTPIDVLARLDSARDDVPEALVRLDEAVHTHLPYNLFLDFDLLAVQLFQRSQTEVVHITALIERLVEEFGGKPIQFRYVHDFLYGFDWQKWVRCAPQERAHIGPFDVEFLTRLLCRAGELRELITKCDSKYHPISETEHRNPFPFSRTSDNERRLYKELSRRGLIPVETYDTHGRCRADLPFTQLREDVAQELGLSLAEEGAYAHAGTSNPCARRA